MLLVQHRLYIRLSRTENHNVPEDLVLFRVIFTEFVAGYLNPANNFSNAIVTVTFTPILYIN